MYYETSPVADEEATQEAVATIAPSRSRRVHRATLDRLFAAFESPSAEWRGKPFWAWNGRLDEKELLRQVEVFRAMGFGGFFIHSRTGLATEYLGEEWFRLANRVADHAESLGLEAWLYDEDRWPSGIAGGEVTRDIEHRAKFISLRWRQATGEAVAAETVLGRFVCRFDPETLAFRELRRLDESDEIPDDPALTLLEFTEEVCAPRSFYNGFECRNDCRLGTSRGRVYRVAGMDRFTCFQSSATS